MAIRMFRLIVAVLPLVLGGCVTSMVAASGIDFDNLSISKLLGREPAPQTVVETPLYCYETLAREECYLEPLVGAEARLQGFVGPTPAPMMR